MMKNSKKILACLIILTMLICCACKSNASEDIHVPAEGEITIYYISNDGYSLVPFYQVVEGEDTHAKVDYVLDALSNAPNGYNSVITEDIPIQNDRVIDGVVTLFCSSDYLLSAASKEILWRAAVVKSLCNVEGVEGVQIYVSDQPLMDASGVEVGILNADSFEDSVNSKLGEITLKMYFTDISGQWLMAENRTIQYPSDEPKELYIIKALIDGPDENGHYPVLSENVVINEVSVSDGICYLYFEQSFLNDAVDIAPLIPIYALVNTLSELSEISRVQFVIDGDSNPMFRNTVSLSKALSANLDLIKKE